MATVTNLLSSSQITSLIQQASAAFQLPAAVLQTQEVPIKAQISALGKVQGALSSLQSALAGLANVGSLAQRTVSASPSGIVQADVSNAAAPGTYSLSNIRLAHAETLISSGSSSASGSLGSGSIAIAVGTGSTVTVNVASGTSSLSGIASAIDQANVGVNATVVFDGANYHLVLTGTATGAANAFTVSGTGGLAGLSYSAGSSGASGGLSLGQAATNAGFSFNGLAITSGSNKVSGVLPGVSLTLAGSGSATLTVSQSVADLDSAAQNLVQALNGALATINQQTAFSAASSGGSGSSGPLLGNVGLELLRTNLLSAVTAGPGASSAAGSPYSSLSAVGFGVTRDGTVTFNDATFQAAAQANYAAVASLLAAGGIASNANVAVDSVAAAPPGSYAVNVSANANGTVVGTVNGFSASGSEGELVVNDSASPLYGLALQIAPGIVGDLGSVSISRGLYGSLSSLVGVALASGSGSIGGQIDSLNTSIAAMNQQIAALQKEATQQTQALTAQFSVAQATLQHLTTVSNFLDAYFGQASGSGG